MKLFSLRLYWKEKREWTNDQKSEVKIDGEREMKQKAEAILKNEVKGVSKWKGNIRRREEWSSIRRGIEGEWGREEEEENAACRRQLGRKRQGEKSGFRLAAATAVVASGAGGREEGVGKISYRPSLSPSLCSFLPSPSLLRPPRQGRVSPGFGCASAAEYDLYERCAYTAEKAVRSSLQLSWRPRAGCGLT